MTLTKITNPGELPSADSATVMLSIPWPGTESGWEQWLRRRAKFRLAVAQWVVNRCRHDPALHAETELREVLAMLELTLDDDVRLRARYDRVTRHRWGG